MPDKERKDWSSFNWTRTFNGLLLIWTIGLVAVFAEMDIARILGYLGDGAGYYLQTARNAATGHGLSFDGIRPTNGFHPLWMACLIVLVKMVGSSSEVIYRAAGILAVICTSAGILLLHRTLRAALSPLAAFAGGAACAFVAFKRICLMESGVVLLVTSALLYFGLRKRVFAQYRAGSAFGFGLLLGVAILARLDLGLLSVVIGVACLYRVLARPAEWKQELLRLGFIVLGASLLVLPILARNQLQFGSPVPISGRLEMRPGFPSFHEIAASIQAAGRWILIPLFGVAAYLVVRSVGALKGSRIVDAEPIRYLRAAALLGGIACVAHAGNEFVFLVGIFYWHFGILASCTGLVVALLVEWLEARVADGTRTWLRLGIPAAAVLMMALVFVRFTKPDYRFHWHQAAYAEALWMRSHLDPLAVVAMPAPEVTGFFNERRTLDLDGLSGHPSLQLAIREHRLKDYLRTSGVSHYAQARFFEEIQTDVGSVVGRNYSEGQVRFRGLYRNSSSDPLLLRRSDEVYHECVKRPDGTCMPAVVWRLPDSL
jgi:hypothetical protein